MTQLGQKSYLDVTSAGRFLPVYAVSSWKHASDVPIEGILSLLINI